MARIFPTDGTLALNSLEAAVETPGLEVHMPENTGLSGSAVKSNIARLTEANYTPEQADAIARTHDSAVIDTALSVSHDYTKQERQEFADELKLQSSDNYSVDARFEAVPDKPHCLDKARNYVAASIEELKTAFSDGRFGRAALAGAKVVAVVGGAGLAGYALFGNVQGADAAPINPLDDTNSMSPTDTVLFPSGYGNGTGAGSAFNGINDINTWYASTDDGFLLKYDGKTFQTAIDAGLPGASGVDLLGENSFIVSAGTTLYFGHLDSSDNWVNDSSIDLTSYGITDVANGRGLADLFIPTASNGVYAIRGGTLGEQIDTANIQAYDVIKLDKTKYTHDMGILDGEGYKLLDNNGVPVGGAGTSKMIDLSPPDTITGDAQTKENRFIVMGAGFSQYANDNYVSGIIPEPATILLMGAGGAYLLVKRKETVIFS